MRGAVLRAISGNQWMKVTKGTIDRIWHHWEIKERGKNLLDFDQKSVVVLLID